MVLQKQALGHPLKALTEVKNILHTRIRSHGTSTVPGNNMSCVQGGVLPHTNTATFRFIRPSTRSLRLLLTAFYAV